MTTPTTRLAWRTGPVAITGASGQVGRRLQSRLRTLPNRVLPLDRGDDPRTAIREAEVVVHLAGTLQPRRPNTYRAANLDTVHATVDALADSGAQRVVFLSFLTADPASPNTYLRYKAEAEEALAASGIPTVVLRAGHVYGPPERPGPTASSFLARRGRVSILGEGTQRLSPVFLDDVVEVIVHAGLDPQAPVGTFELTGPEVFTVDEFARRLNGDTVRLRHLPPALAAGLARVVPSLPGPLVDVLLHDAVATGHPDAVARQFGVSLHRIADVWPAPPHRPTTVGTTDAP